MQSRFCASRGTTNKDTLQWDIQSFVSELMPALLACLMEAVAEPNMIKRIEAWLCPVGQSHINILIESD